VTEDGEVLSRVALSSHEQRLALELRVHEVEVLHHLNELVLVFIHIRQVLSRVRVRESSADRLVNVDHSRVVRPRTNGADVYVKFVIKCRRISVLCDSLVNLKRAVEEEVSEG